MFRLAEYFVVFGYDFEKSKHNQSEGKIIQKFPTKDWADYKYQIQVELFCQPCGWELSDVKHSPKYLVAYLTDPEANQYYLACLSFHEAISSSYVDQDNVGSRQINRNSRNLSNLHCTTSSDSDIDRETSVEDPNLIKPANKYAPKSLILLARHGFFDILKNCLSIIYTFYMDPHREISLEYIIGNILSAVEVPPIGGCRISFTVGAGDKQIIQPPACPSLPVTRTCVSMLFKHLGMQNVLAIFSSLINDQKILLYSRSFNRLTEACHSLRSLLYPLKYGNVFIPILPKKLIEILSTPTPFLAGVHSTYRPLYDLNDVVMVDLDGGSVKYPDNVPLVALSEPYNSLVIDSLTKILNPDLLTADEVYPPPPTALPDPAWQDKQLRAVFIRLFCRLFAGYRSCLTLTRIRPKPVIHFNQSLFLLLRGLRDETGEFVSRLLSCMSFGQFIQDRGIPYRVCDVFDDEYESMTELLRSKYDTCDDLPIIDKLAKKLYDNECRGAPFVHTLPQEAKMAHTRLHTPALRILDQNAVADHIKSNLQLKTNVQKAETFEPRFVSHGLELDKHIFKTEALSDKNKVIREFVANIFNNHITEALKRLNTIRQDLKKRLIRRIFVDELYRQLYPDQADTFNLNIGSYNTEVNHERKAVLGYQQFDLINDLMGEALRHESQKEDSGVVPIIMELSTKFCTQLNNVKYYSNMTYQIQQHPVWESQKFWITVFCDQVNNEIRQLYLHHSVTQYRLRNDRIAQADKVHSNLIISDSVSKSQRSNIDRSWSRNAGISSQPSLTSRRTMQSTSTVEDTVPTRILYSNKMSALDMAAEEMKIVAIADPEVQNQEESTIYSEILHFLNLIVNFRIPINIVDKNEQRPLRIHHQHRPAHSYSGDGDGNSAASSASEISGSESGYEDGDYTNTRISNLEAWLKKFVDKTASDNNLSLKLIENIKWKIEGIIEGHISNLETIYPEVQNVPKVKKVEVTSPVLLPSERVILINGKESVRCYLLLDGRCEKIDIHRQRQNDFDDVGVQFPKNHHCKIIDDDDDFYALRQLLPAQGALFITNYRVVFHGSPKDPYQSNKLICRSFPIAALRSIKKLGVKTFAMTSGLVSHGRNFIGGKHAKMRGIEGSLDVLRLCSNTFQMLKIGLESEDSSVEIKDELIIKLMFLRYPSALSLSFNISDKIDLKHQKPCYFSGLPDDCSFVTAHHQPSESISSLYSSMQTYSISPTVHSIQSSREQKNNFSRNTGAMNKEKTLNKMLKVKERTSPSSLNKKKCIYETESEPSSVIHEDEEYNLPIIDAKLLDKLRVTPGYQEYVRLNLINNSSNICVMDQILSRSDTVRLILNFNDRYQNVKTYQSMMVVPQVFNEASLKKFAKTHRKNRFPIITWKSNKTNSYLLRGAGFQNQGFMGKLLKQSGGNQVSSGNNLSGGTQMIRNAAATLQRGFHTMTLKTIYDEGGPEHEITAAREQIRYFQSLVDISPSYDDIQLHLSNINPIVQWSDNANQRSVAFKRNPIEKAYKNMMSSGSKAKTNPSGLFLDDKRSRCEYSGKSFKYADEDEEAGLSDVESQCGTLKYVGDMTGKEVDVRPCLLARDNHNVSSRRSFQDPLVGQRIETQFKRNSSMFIRKSTQSRSFSLSPSNVFSTKEGNIKFTASEDDMITNESISSTQFSELRIVRLYILVEKAQLKTMGKSENLQDIEFVAVDFTGKLQIKEAYEALIKAVLPDNVSSVPIINHSISSNANKYQDQQMSFDNTSAVAANKWLVQVQSLMELSGTVVDLIDIQSGSVAVCLEEGWDATCQIVSLAQIMLDRHYRTIEGFWALVEKDWLMAGHKFESRLNMTSQSKTGHYIPVFLQFLDAVNQLLIQFPMSFEFNGFMLKFLAYHHTSNRFHNFKMNCEAERIAWLRSYGDDSSIGSILYKSNSLRNYIVHHHQEWPVFFNFLYNPNLSQEVLRPCTSLAMISIWEYFLNEDLSSGSVYDLDHFCPSYRKRNTQQYDPILNGAFNNSHVTGIYGVLGLREGCEVKNWQKIWHESNQENNADMRNLESILYNVYENQDVDINFTTNSSQSPGGRSHKHVNYDTIITHFKQNKVDLQFIKDACYDEHKNVSLLKLEKLHLDNFVDNVPVNNGSDDTSYLVDKDHNFQRLPIQSEFQTVCQLCLNHAPITSGTILIHCSRCNIICHDKCWKVSNRPCHSAHQTTLKSMSMDALSGPKTEIDNLTITIPVPDFINQTPPTRSYTMPRETSPVPEIQKRKSEDFSAEMSEVIFSGDLWKLSQHSLFTSWQRKYFTLDIIRHELRYCDSKDSGSNVKRINIQDITGVRILKTLHNHQKRFPESGFLEIKTEERTFRLASESQSVINEWMEKIQNSIQ